MTPPTHQEYGKRPHLPPWRLIYDRIAPFLALVILLIALGAGVGTYINDRAVDRSNADRIADNEDNAVTNCENANETRKANRTLWNFVLDLSQSGNSDATAQEVAYLEQFRAWIGKVYQERDCTDLGREYPLPPPPTLPAG